MAICFYESWRKRQRSSLPCNSSGCFKLEKEHQFLRRCVDLLLDMYTEKRLTPCAQMRGVCWKYTVDIKNTSHRLLRLISLVQIFGFLVAKFCVIRASILLLFFK